jgi:hypothetical protein
MRPVTPCMMIPSLWVAMECCLVLRLINYPVNYGVGRGPAQAGRAAA